MRRRLIWIVSAGILIWLCAVIAVDQFGKLDQTRSADVIVVLGSRVYPGGIPGPALTRRARHAAGLWERGLATVVICSGGIGQGEQPPSEARAACNLVGGLGVVPESIFLEEQARSTEESSLFVSDMMRANSWDEAILVTDGFHMFRSWMLFERAGVVVYPSPAQLSTYPMQPFERFVRINRELVAIGWYWFKTALGLDITDVQ